MHCGLSLQGIEQIGPISRTVKRVFDPTCPWPILEAAVWLGQFHERPTEVNDHDDICFVENCTKFSLFQYFCYSMCIA